MMVPMHAPPPENPATATGIGDVVSPLRPAWMLWLSVSGLAVFVVVATHVALAPDGPLFQGVDDAWRSRIGSPGPENTPAVLFLQFIGRAQGVAVVSAVALVALACARRWRHALFFLVAVDLGAILASYVPKYLVGRPRPAADVEAGLHGPLFEVGPGSFPSGHSVAIAVMIVGIAALLPAHRRWIWWIVGALLAVAMAWQRTLVNAHWLSDTLAGLTVGACTAMLAWWALYPLVERDRGRPLRGERIIPQVEADDPPGGRPQG